MNPQDTSSVVKREHLLSVAIAKHVFLHDDHGVVFSRTPITLLEAERFGLSPVILYAVTVAGTSLRWLCFAPFQAPLSLCEVLQTAWRTAGGLRGTPDMLKISRFVGASSPTLTDTLARINVRVEIANGSDKSFSATLRSAQNHVLALGWGGLDGRRINSLSELHVNANADHNGLQTHGAIINIHPGTAVATKSFLALPERPLSVSLPDKMDWELGEWLSSWESALPPSHPRYFHKSEEAMWLLDGEQEDDEDQEDEIFRDDESLDEDDLADEETPSDFAPIDLETATSVKHILNCWPNKTVEVARAVGVTAKELKWYVGGRAPLDRTKLSDLLSLVGLEYDSSSDFYQSCGPCVLIAFSPRSIVEAYTSLAHGGDLEFSFEVLPSLIPADPSWRYMLFRACGDMINIIMLPRGGKVAENLNRDSFINFGGSVNVPDNIYRNLVATCGRACKSPLANRHEVERFYRENLEFFDTLEEKYRHR